MGDHCSAPKISSSFLYLLFLLVKVEMRIKGSWELIKVLSAKISRLNIIQLESVRRALYAAIVVTYSAAQDSRAQNEGAPALVARHLIAIAGRVRQSQLRRPGLDRVI